MPTFCIITPTISGRTKKLQRAIRSVELQTSDDYLHVVCGDGCDPEIDTRSLHGRLLIERTDKNYGAWGWGVRNHIIQKYKDQCRYFMFLDDDNMMLPHCLAKVAQNLKTPLIAHQVLYHHPEVRKQVIMPTCLAEIDCGNMDTLCITARADIASKVQWKPVRAQDMQFFHDCMIDLNHSAGRVLNGSWKTLLSHADLVTFVSEVLGAYYPEVWPLE